MASRPQRPDQPLAPSRPAADDGISASGTSTERIRNRSETVELYGGATQSANRALHAIPRRCPREADQSDDHPQAWYFGGWDLARPLHRWRSRRLSDAARDAGGAN